MCKINYDVDLLGRVVLLQRSLSGLIKFYTNIIKWNKLSDLLGLTLEKALLKRTC